MIATIENDLLRIDGRLANPKNSIYSGMTCYYIGNAGNVIERLISDNDKAYKSSPKAKPSYTFTTNNGGKLRILSAEVWTGADSAIAAEKEINTMRSAISEEGLKWAITPGSLAGRICRDNAPTRQLAPRWRQLAHSAIHQGPMVCLMGGAENAVSLDRERAFLQAIYAPVPTGDWCPVPPGALDAVYDLPGIIKATVRIPRERYAGMVPPLPVRLHGYTIYPVGTVKGTWTLDMLRDAITNGYCEIETVHEIMVCQALPLHAVAAERIERIKDKQLRKMLYTRYWGRLAATGGYEGFRSMLFPNPRNIMGSDLHWYYFGISPTSHIAPPDYRPDHAAFISSHNHIAMNRALRKYKKDTVIATHVDCIWTNDETVNPGETLREKQRGKARFYGVGCYKVGEAMAAQGFSGKLDEKALETWGSKLNGGNNLYRQWHFGIEPSKSEYATSDPPFHDPRIAAAEAPMNLPGNIYWQGWTSNGWIRNNNP